MLNPELPPSSLFYIIFPVPARFFTNVLNPLNTNGSIIGFNASL